MSRTVYERVGVAPFINASGTVTVLGGSLMEPEVLAAMREAANAYVDIPKFLENAGDYLAELIGVPGVCICSGAAGGVAVAVAAALTGDDPAYVYALPRTGDRPNEIIALSSPRPNYIHQAAEIVGGKIVEVGIPGKATVDDFAAAIGLKTAAILYVYPWVEATLATAGNKGATISAVANLARAHGVPLIVDAASELPPRDKLRTLHDDGADLVVFSGGKGIFGPQATGMIVGRAELSRACRLNGSPHSSVARGMKIGKEETAGLIAAVERFMARDERAAFAEWERRARTIASIIGDVPGATVRVAFPDPRGRPPELPRCFIELHDPALGTPRELLDRLVAGSPSVHVRLLADGVFIETMTLKAGEDQIVGERVRDALLAPSRAPLGATIP
jgi:L-seryl-tRNA(Ser) seleniumtransferase